VEAFHYHNNIETRKTFQQPYTPIPITDQFISLLPALENMFEKIILKKLMPIAQNENILPDIQFGFIIDFISSSLETKKILLRSC